MPRKSIKHRIAIQLPATWDLLSKLTRKLLVTSNMSGKKHALVNLKFLSRLAEDSMFHDETSNGGVLVGRRVRLHAEDGWPPEAHGGMCFHR